MPINEGIPTRDGRLLTLQTETKPSKYGKRVMSWISPHPRDTVVNQLSKYNTLKTGKLKIKPRPSGQLSTKPKPQLAIDRVGSLNIRKFKDVTKNKYLKN